MHVCRQNRVAKIESIKLWWLQVFPESNKAAFKGESAAMELKHLKAVDARVVPKVAVVVVVLVLV